LPEGVIVRSAEEGADVVDAKSARRHEGDCFIGQRRAFVNRDEVDLHHYGLHRRQHVLRAFEDFELVALDVELQEIGALERRGANDRVEGGHLHGGGLRGTVAGIVEDGASGLCLVKRDALGGGRPQEGRCEFHTIVDLGERP